jgi:Tfp pilus assembly protein PilF
VVVEPPQPDYDHVYAKAMIKLGDDAFSAGYYKQALGHYDEALREWEDYRIYMKIAYCLKKLGNERDFRLVYAKAVSMAPKNAKKTKYTPVVYKYTGVGM